MYLLVVAFYGVSPQDILRDMREYLELDAIVLEADVSEFFRPEDAYYFSSFQENVDVGDIESAVRNLRRLVDLPYIPTDLKTYLLIQESRYLTGLKRQDEAIQVLNDAVPPKIRTTG